MFYRMICFWLGSFFLVEAADSQEWKKQQAQELQKRYCEMPYFDVPKNLNIDAAHGGDRMAQQRIFENFCFGCLEFLIEPDEWEKIIAFHSALTDYEKLTDLEIFFQLHSIEPPSRLTDFIRRVRCRAESDHPFAQGNLGILHNVWWAEMAMSINYRERQKQRKYWIKKAANQGWARAQYDLGLLYKEGFGNAGSKCIDWMTKSAEQGFIKAQEQLGFLYSETGWANVRGDKNKSKFWYKVAAKRGHPVAQFNLAVFYEIDCRPLKAFEWGAIAAERGLEKARIFLVENWSIKSNIDDYTPCTPEQLEKAKKDKQGWEDYLSGPLTRLIDSLECFYFGEEVTHLKKHRDDYRLILQQSQSPRWMLTGLDLEDKSYKDSVTFMGSTGPVVLFPPVFDDPSILSSDIIGTSLYKLRGDLNFFHRILTQPSFSTDETRAYVRGILFALTEVLTPPHWSVPFLSFFLEKQHNIQETVVWLDSVIQEISHQLNLIVSFEKLVDILRSEAPMRNIKFYETIFICSCSVCPQPPLHEQIKAANERKREEGESRSIVTVK